MLEKIKHDEDIIKDIFLLNDSTNIKDDANIKDVFLYKTETPKESLINKFNKVESRFNYLHSSFIILTILLLVLAKTIVWRSFLQLFESVISHKKYKSWLTNSNSYLSEMFYFTIPAYLIIITVAFDYILIEYYNYDSSEQRLLLLLVIISFVYFVRLLLIRISAFFFNAYNTIKEQIRYILLFNSLNSILLIFVVPFCIYTPNINLLLPLIFVIVVVEIIRIYKSIISIISLKEYNLYYFFLYFCTVEILAPLVFIKMVASYFDTKIF